MFCTLVTMFLATVSVAQAQQTASMSIINHNIKSGGRPQEAADSIVSLMETPPDKALVLVNEANYAREYFDLPHPAWHHIWPGSPHEGRGNAIFTRDAAATMLSSWVLAMEEPWTHNQPKDPRVYPVVKCQMVVSPWVQFHCVNVHFPTNRTGNGPARQESINRLIALSESKPDIPFIICGDFNMGATAARNSIADEIGGQLYSDASVDHIIVRPGKDVGFENVSVVKLGLLGSDHHAIRYNLTFVQLPDPSHVSDWTLY